MEKQTTKRWVIIGIIVLVLCGCAAGLALAAGAAGVSLGPLLSGGKPIPFLSTPTFDLSILYREQVGQKADDCSAAMKDFQGVNGEMTADTSLLDDMAWKTRLAQALADMNLSCGALAQDNPPAEFAEVNSILQEAGEEYRTFTQMYQTGIDTKDVDAIQAAITHMVNGNAYMQRALEGINAINNP